MIWTKDAARRFLVPAVFLSCGMAVLAFFPILALAQPGFVVTSPIASSVFYPGQGITITWTGGDPTWNVDLTFADVDLNAAIVAPALNIPNSGNFPWNFPSTVNCGHTYEFYVQNVQRTSWAYGPHFSFVCEVPIGIKIKPGSCPNTINPKSEGMLLVAILSSSTFDARTVDQSTLTFGRTGSEHSLAFCNPNPEDTNGDGLLNLLCHFNTAQAQFLPGDTVGILRAKTTAGQSIIATDSVRIVPLKKSQ